MEADFYPTIFGRHGIRVVLPSPADRAYAHQVYFDELAKGVFRPETKAGLLAVIERLHGAEPVQAVVLGGTELPLSLGDGAEAPVPLLDTTRLHTTALLRAAFPE
jgi:aspartate racemase